VSPPHFDVEALYQRLDQKRRRQRLSWRDVGRQADILSTGLPASPWANPYPAKVHGPHQAIALYRLWLSTKPGLVARARAELAGRDLACWCPTGQPCHADVLLAVACG